MNSDLNVYTWVLFILESGCDYLEQGSLYQKISQLPLLALKSVLKASHMKTSSGHLGTTLTNRMDTPRFKLSCVFFCTICVLLLPGTSAEWYDNRCFLCNDCSDPFYPRLAFAYKSVPCPAGHCRKVTYNTGSASEGNSLSILYIKLTPFIMWLEWAVFL